MKIDARVRYTKKAIKSSFFSLLKEKPLNKVTVKSICELSEINRATFYKYYADPYDLLKQIEAELILELHKLIEKDDSKNVTETLIVILNNMKENCEAYTILGSDHGDSTFTSQVFSLCYQTKQSVLKEILPNMSGVQQEWFYYFLAQGSSSIFNCWVRNGMKEEPLEVSRFISRLNATILREFQ